MRAICLNRQAHPGLLFSFRYILDPKKKPPIKLQPPFIRPDLSDRQVTIKISDNGIHSTIIRSKVSRAVRAGLAQFGPIFTFQH